MVSGEVPQEVAPFMCSARLFGIAKKGGGVRPIAVGGLLRRLVSRCCAARLRDRAIAYLSPHQLGVGVMGGCEAVVHTVRQALEADPTLFCLQVDLINAFNLVSRKVGLEEVASNFPEILAWTKTCYGQPSNLLYGEHHIASECAWLAFPRWTCGRYR